MQCFVVLRSTHGEQHDGAGTRARARGPTADVTDAASSSTLKSKRQSLGAATNSPFLAGSLRNPVLSQLANASVLRSRRGQVNSLMYDVGEVSDSDQEYSFVEMASSGVSTTAGLHNMADTSPSAVGDLRGKNKQRTGGASGKSRGY